MSELTYLAYPFNHPDESVRMRRYNAVTKSCALLMQSGRHTISLITHNIPLFEYEMPRGWDFWGEYDSNILSRCDNMIVCRAPGWKESKGVTAEIKFAEEKALPIEYMDVDDEGIVVF